MRSISSDLCYNLQVQMTKKIIPFSTGSSNKDRKWFLPLTASASVSICLLIFATFTSDSLLHWRNSSFTWLFSGREVDDPDMYVESRLGYSPPSKHPSPPSLAYLISGTKGDGNRMKRTLQAVYHPKNHYVLHLDLEAPPRERVELTRYVKLQPTFLKAGNVHVIGKPNLVTYRGPTMIACTLHAAAILLRQSKDWDWFINLSASDYPLVTQDDLLHVLSKIPKDLNFIEHTSDIGWKEFQRAKPIIVDPGLYMSKKSEIFWATQRRALPNSFKLFTGSAWVTLTRSFIEFCVWGWDNLPRRVLMYYTNFVSSPEGYFHTVICNTRQFQNTTVNHDLHYIAWDNPPKQHPLSLGFAHFQNMTESGAPFARKFEKDDPVLDKIDQELLGREKYHFTPGGWCQGRSGEGDPCAVIGNSTSIKPGKGASRFENLVMRLMSAQNFYPSQCVTY